MNNLTCVSGYWQIKNKHNNKFEEWFKNTLNINCPYIFFGDKNSLEIIKKYRNKNLPTHYIELNIEEFYTYKYKDSFNTHHRHCPSKELNMIWNEKIFLLERAIELNYFKTEYFMWIDAGICIYRDCKPPDKVFPDNKKLNLLPKDKIIYSSTEKYYENNVNINKYYHHIAATSYLFHKSIIDKLINLYKVYLDKLINSKNIQTEQVVLTHMYKDNKDLFYKLCDGYGKIVYELY